MTKNSLTICSRSIYLVLIAFLVTFMFLLGDIRASSLAQPPDTNISETRTGLEETVETAFGKKKPANDIPVILGKIVLFGLGLVGIVFFTLIILAGFKWMTAGGHADDLEKAQEMLRQAIIGIIITMGSAAITWFILKNLETATTKL